MLKDDEIQGVGNSYTAMFWQYDSRLGRRWNQDPVVKERQSNYHTFSNNPISRIDPKGDDDYYNYAGKYVGSDGVKSTQIRIVTSRDDFETYLNLGVDILHKMTDIITLQENYKEYVVDIYSKSVQEKVEQKAYIILDTKNFTLGVEKQNSNPEDKVDKSVNIFEPMERGGDNYFSPKGDDGNKVIIGQIHGHPGKELGRNVATGPSEDDKLTAKKLSVPVYPIDNENIHKVDQNGKITSTNKEKNNFNILIDSLETSSGKITKQ